MSKATAAARFKAIRLCGEGAPSMRRQREDGGAAGDGGTGNGSSSGNPEPSPMTVAPPIAPASTGPKTGDDTDSAVSIKVGGEPTGPRPLNAGIMQRGGRTR